MSQLNMIEQENSCLQGKTRILTGMDNFEYTLKSNG